MKTRESGLQEEAMWSRFFDPEAIFDAFLFAADTGDSVDFGCGYGTFALLFKILTPYSTGLSDKNSIPVL